MSYRELLRRFGDRVLIDGALDALRTLPDDFFHVVVTSPPYYGLRDYGTRMWFGGDNPDCEHGEVKDAFYEGHRGNRGQTPQTKWPNQQEYPQHAGVGLGTCVQCGAWLGQIGLEPTPELFITHLVEIFREVRRVLRPDGVCWVNIAASYVRAGCDGGAFKEKDLIGIPWLLAMALQADGWYLRGEVIWEKPKILPQSVRDRPTVSHEQLFLLTRRPHYFYDAEGYKEPVSGERAATRNARSVWRISPQSYHGAHDAPFPPELPRRCIRLGSSEHGACSECGAPFARILERVIPEASRFESNVVPNNTPHQKFSWGQQKVRDENPPITKGWEPTCKCQGVEVEPCIALDPFSGSGTTLAVSVEEGRRYVGIELNESYKPLIDGRLRGPTEEANERGLFSLMEHLDEDFGDDA